MPLSFLKRLLHFKFEQLTFKPSIKPLRRQTQKIFSERELNGGLIFMQPADII